MGILRYDEEIRRQLISSSELSLAGRWFSS